MIGKQEQFFAVFCGLVFNSYTMEIESSNTSLKAKEEFELEMKTDNPNAQALCYCLSIFNKAAYEEIKTTVTKYTHAKEQLECLKKQNEKINVYDKILQEYSLDKTEKDLQRINNAIVIHLKKLSSSDQSNNKEVTRHTEVTKKPQRSLGFYNITSVLDFIFS